MTLLLAVTIMIHETNCWPFGDYLAILASIYDERIIRPFMTLTIQAIHLTNIAVWLYTC